MAPSFGSSVGRSPVPSSEPEMVGRMLLQATRAPTVAAGGINDGTTITGLSVMSGVLVVLIILILLVWLSRRRFRYHQIADTHVAETSPAAAEQQETANPGRASFDISAAESPANASRSNADMRRENLLRVASDCAAEGVPLPEELKIEAVEFLRQQAPRIGIGVEENDNGPGLVITAIASQGSGAAAGLVKGDVLLEFNRVGLMSPVAFSDLVAATQAGEMVALNFLRDGVECSVALRMGAAGVSLGTIANVKCALEGTYPDRDPLGKLKRLKRLLERAANPQTETELDAAEKEEVKQALAAMTQPSDDPLVETLRQAQRNPLGALQRVKRLLERASDPVARGALSEAELEELTATLALLGDGHGGSLGHDPDEDLKNITARAISLELSSPANTVGPGAVSSRRGASPAGTVSFGSPAGTVSARKKPVSKLHKAMQRGFTQLNLMLDPEIPEQLSPTNAESPVAGAAAAATGARSPVAGAGVASVERASSSASLQQSVNAKLARTKTGLNRMLDGEEGDSSNSDSAAQAETDAAAAAAARAAAAMDAALAAMSKAEDRTRERAAENAPLVVTPEEQNKAREVLKFMQPRLGLALDQNRKANRQGTAGVRVLAVVPGSSAFLAGVMPGDVVRSFNSVHTPSFDVFVAEQKKVKPGDDMLLAIERAGAQLNVIVRMGAQGYSLEQIAHIRAVASYDERGNVVNVVRNKASVYKGAQTKFVKVAVDASGQVQERFADEGSATQEGGEALGIATTDVSDVDRALATMTPNIVVRQILASPNQTRQAVNFNGLLSPAAAGSPHGFQRHAPGRQAGSQPGSQAGSPAQHAPARRPPPPGPQSKSPPAGQPSRSPPAEQQRPLPHPQSFIFSNTQHHSPQQQRTSPQLSPESNDLSRLVMSVTPAHNPRAPQQPPDDLYEVVPNQIVTPAHARVHY